MTARLLLLLLLVPSLSSAQTVTGTLQGTVKDQSGGVLPGAMVSAKNRDTGQVRETVTNGAGYDVLPVLPIGGYEVSTALAGFRTVVHQQLAVTLNDTRVVDFELVVDVDEHVAVDRVHQPRALDLARLEYDVAVGQELDQGIAARLVAEPDFAAHLAPPFDAEFVGDPARNGQGRDAARLRAGDFSLQTAAGREAHLRNLRRFAGAGLAGEDDDLVRLDRSRDFFRARADRQLGRELEAEGERRR